MKNLILEIPADLLDSLCVPLEEKEARLRQELAVRLYQKGLLSFGKARELAKMNKWVFHTLLSEENILRRYDSDDVQEDLQTLEGLN